MQGRLTQSKKNELQKFPKNWKKEFYYLNKTKLDYIEFFTEQKKNKKNPIWSNKNINEIKLKLSKINYKKFILCDNFTVINLIIKKNTKIYLFNLIDRLSQIKYSKLIIPIIFKKNLKNHEFEKYVNSIIEIINHSKKNKVKVSFEFLASAKIVKKFCRKFYENNDFFITYDTGNAYLFDKNFYKDIYFFKNYIDHIHLKDRDIFGNNVILGKGKINFNLFLTKLNTLKEYCGTMTFETNRGTNPIDTANSNLKIIKSFLL